LATLCNRDFCQEIVYRVSKTILLQALTVIAAIQYKLTQKKTIVSLADQYNSFCVVIQKSLSVGHPATAVVLEVFDSDAHMKSTVGNT
jgi:predicted kinase